MFKTKTIFSSLTALMLLAAAATVLPACELVRDCNPEVEICEFTGNHPGGLDPNP